MAADTPRTTPASMRRLPTPLVVTTLLTALAVLAAGCGGDDESSDDRTPTSVVIAADDDTSTTATADGDGDTDSATDNGNGDGATDDATGTEAATVDEPEETTSTTAAPPEPDTLPSETYRLVEVASVAFPTTLIAREGSDDLWVAEREGRVRLLRRNGTGFDLDPEPSLDITDLITTDGEGGLLGMTFSADGQMLYVSYTNNGGDSVVAEYAMAGDQADPDSARILLTVEQPFSNHNGGQVERGPDGLLYVALGDGGSGGDPLDSGQDTSTLLGAILRIDPQYPGGEAA
ncbi:MAG: PQQ-dependent sugar dehydrogenase, partial [Actinomycetota bacterium]